MDFGELSAPLFPALQPELPVYYGNKMRRKMKVGAVWLLQLTVCGGIGQARAAGVGAFGDGAAGVGSR